MCLLLVIPTVISGAPQTLVPKNIGDEKNKEATPTIPILKPQTIIVTTECEMCNFDCEINSVDYSAYADCKKSCDSLHGTCMSPPETPETCIQCNNQCNAQSMVDNDRLAYTQCREKCSASFGSECGTNKYWTPLTCSDCRNNCIGLTGNAKTSCLQDCTSKFGDASCKYLPTIPNTPKYSGKAIQITPQITKKQIPPTIKKVTPGAQTSVSGVPTKDTIKECQNCNYNCTFIPDYTDYKACKDGCTQKLGTCPSFPVTPGGCIQCNNQCNDQAITNDDRYAFLLCREKCSTTFGNECSDSSSWTPVTCQDCFNNCQGLTGNEDQKCHVDCINKFGDPSCPIYSISYTINPQLTGLQILKKTPTPTPIIWDFNKGVTPTFPVFVRPTIQETRVISGERTFTYLTNVEPTIDRGLVSGASDILRPQTQPLINTGFGKTGPIFMSNVSNVNTTLNTTPMNTSKTLVKK